MGMRELCKGSHCTPQEVRDFDEMIARIQSYHEARVQVGEDGRLRAANQGEEIPRAWYVQQALDAVK